VEQYGGSYSGVERGGKSGDTYPRITLHDYLVRQPSTFRSHECQEFPSRQGMWRFASARDGGGHGKSLIARRLKEIQVLDFRGD